MTPSFETNGAATPEFKAAILGEITRLISIQTVVVPYEEVLAHVMNVSGCAEEQVGGDVALAWFLLERTGMIKTTTFGSIEASTNAIPSRLVTDYVWGDPVWFSEVGEGA